MTHPNDDFAAEQARLEALFDRESVLDDSAYCVIGRHDVPRDHVRASPRGSNVCRDCAKTPRGRKEMAEFDPTR